MIKQIRNEIVGEISVILTSTAIIKKILVKHGRDSQEILTIPLYTKRKNGKCGEFNLNDLFASLSIVFSHS